MHRVLQPNLIVVWRQNKLKPIDFVYTWMVVPFFFGIFRLRGENRTKKSLDLVVDL
jgi:hypothetical protein